MMPVVRVNDATFADLSTLKTWLGTATPSETIDQIVREVMDRLGLERDNLPDTMSSATDNGAVVFDKAPSLTFTKPLSASVGGKSVDRPTWSSILLSTIKELHRSGIRGEKLITELRIQAREKRYEQEGFKYHSDLGLSIQGQSAVDAWKEVERLAMKWRIPVNVEFVWSDSPKAQYPGSIGRLQSGVA